MICYHEGGPFNSLYYHAIVWGKDRTSIDNKIREKWPDLAWGKVNSSMKDAKKYAVESVYLLRGV